MTSAPRGLNCAHVLQAAAARATFRALEALSKFVAPPRVHRHRYHGVLAPNARLRPHVVAFGRPETPTAEGNFTAPAPAIAAESAAERASPARIRWAVLLARIYDVLPLLCPGHPRDAWVAAPR